jgi:hypothetical protein
VGRRWPADLTPAEVVDGSGAVDWASTTSLTWSAVRDIGIIPRLEHRYVDGEPENGRVASTFRWKVNAGRNLPPKGGSHTR